MESVADRIRRRAAKGRRVNFTRDLNEEGAFVRTAEMLDLGATTVLLISPPGGEYKPVEVQSRGRRRRASRTRRSPSHGLVSTWSAPASLARST